MGKGKNNQVQRGKHISLKTARKAPQKIQQRDYQIDMSLIPNTKYPFRDLDPQTEAYVMEKCEYLLYHIAYKFLNPKMELEDLVQVGWIGYMQAKQSYDTTKGVKFSTYLYRVVKNLLITQSRKEEKDALDYSISEDEYKKQSAGALDTDKKGQGNSVADVRFIAANPSRIHTGETERQVMVSECVDFICELMKSEHFTDVERFVFQCRLYSEGGYPRITQMECAEILGLTQAAICQIETTLKNKLRLMLMSENYDADYLNGLF